MPKGVKRARGGDDVGDRKSKRLKEQPDEDTILDQLKPLKANLGKFLTGASTAQYRGGGVKIGGAATPGPLKASHKFEVNRIGRTSGCHTCGKAPNDVWISDHIPPKNLSENAISHYWPKWKKGSYRFFPHCNTCAEDQSKLVKKLNAIAKKKSAFPALSAKEKSNIHHQDLSLSIKGQKADASDKQRDEMQDFGDSDGCHTCKKKLASTKFDADHVPPQEFGTAYFQYALSVLKIRVPKWQVRPQCKTCSRSQGDDVKQMGVKIRKILTENGLAVFK